MLEILSWGFWNCLYFSDQLPIYWDIWIFGTSCRIFAISFIKTGHERNPEGGVTISRHDQGRSGGSGSSVHQGQQGLGSHPAASDSVERWREPHLAGHGQAQSFSFLEATPSPPGQDPEQEQESVFIVCIYWSQTFYSANTEHCLAGMVCVVPAASVYKHLYRLQHTSIQ